MRTAIEITMALAQMVKLNIMLEKISKFSERI